MNLRAESMNLALVLCKVDYNSEGAIIYNTISG